MYGHRMGQPPQASGPRYMELLEALKNEFEGIYQEASFNKYQREDSELKAHNQLLDISSIQKALFDLERAHLKMKHNLEEEIARLKHELGDKSHAANGNALTSIQFPTFPNLEAELTNFASGFSSIISQLDVGMKRNLEDDSSMGTQRNMRSREEFNAQMFLQSRRTQLGHTPYSAAPSPHLPPGMMRQLPNGNSGPGLVMPMALPSIPAPHAPNTAMLPQGLQELGRNVAPQSGGGFDWLVVYNPKATRTLTVDLLHTFTHENVVCCVRFSHDGKLLATGSNRVANIYEVKTGNKIATLSDTEGVENGEDQFVRSAAFSPDGTLLITGSEDKIVRVWDIRSQTLKIRMSGHTQDIYSVDFMPNGKEVISGSGDRTIKIWDLEAGACRVTMSVGHVDANKDAGITSVAVSPSGKFVAAGCLDRSVRIWNAETGAPLDSLEGHRDSVYSVVFSLDGKSLISGSLDKTVKLWSFDSADSLSRGSCKYTILGHKDFVLSVCCTPPDNRWIVSGSKDRSVQFWDSQNNTTQLMLQGHKNSVISVAMSPSGAYFATGSGDCRARIWTLQPYGVQAKSTVSSPISTPPAVGPSIIKSPTTEGGPMDHVTNDPESEKAPAAPSGVSTPAPVTPVSPPPPA